MVSFHSYVSLPEGKISQLKYVSLITPNKVSRYEFYSFGGWVSRGEGTQYPHGNHGGSFQHYHVFDALLSRLQHLSRHYDKRDPTAKERTVPFFQGVLWLFVRYGININIIQKTIENTSRSYESCQDKV